MDITVVGNPGMGKSTILSTISGMQFKSGIAFGSGLTKKLQFQPPTGNVRYADTPGLADPECKEMAAEAIYEALESATKNNRTLKLILVCTLESGRVREADLQTMDFIMDSIRPSNEMSLEQNKYSVIINKCSKNVFRKLDEENEEYPGMTNREVLCGHFQKASPNLRFTTDRILLVKRVDELEDADNIRFSAEVESGITNFIETTNSMNIAKAKVSRINTDTIDEMRKKMAAENAKQKKQWMAELQEETERRRSEESVKTCSLNGMVLGNIAFAEIGARMGMRLGLVGAVVGGTVGFGVAAVYNAYGRLTEKDEEDDDDVVGN